MSGERITQRRSSMKSAFVILAIVLTLADQVLGAGDPALKSEKDKLSYTIGVSTGKNLKKQSVDIDPEMVLKGLKDGLAGGKTLLTVKEMDEVMTALQNDMAARRKDIMKALAEKNKKEETTFFAENKKKEGVKTLPSGLQYKVLKEGRGRSPKATDTVIAHYRGSLLDGTEFDSSYQRNEPSSIDLKHVIKGWTEAIPLMKEGAKWQLFIPSALAYGENGGGLIEPNAALVFEVELISVSKGSASPSPTPGEKTSKPGAAK
jgi:FKBP-type peptidyl-prolyl cis-trans isomerase